MITKESLSRRIVDYFKKAREGDFEVYYISEEEAYEDLNSKLPNVGDFVTTKDGFKGEVQSVSVLKQRVKVVITKENDEKEVKEDAGRLVQKAKEAGADHIYKVGGAQAIAALAYGTPLQKRILPGHQMGAVHSFHQQVFALLLHGKDTA